MKKYIGILLTLICVYCLSSLTFAAEVKSYNFDNTDGIETVTNTLGEGGIAVVENGVLELSSSYALDLGEVGDVFSVSAMINVKSTGDFETVLFKNIGDATNQKWTGFKYEKGIPTVWTQGDGFEWAKAVVAKEAYTNKWVHFVYVENNGLGALYLDGALIGSGEVVKGKGHLYLGATLWAGDAINGNTDNVVLFDSALTEEEVQAEHEKNVNYYINVPDITISDIRLTNKVGTAEILWTSSDESVIKHNGEVIRADEDKQVKLTASIHGNIVAEYDVRVLKKAEKINDKVILSYDFSEIDNGIIRDKSGNGNDAIAHNGLIAGKEGAIFDGKDDYVEMAKGTLYNHDEITITATIKPDGAQKNVALYTFGNSVEEGYMFLNPSRPGTNFLRFAITDTNAEKEIEIASIPGIGHNEWATVTIVIKGSKAEMYLNGELVMDGDLGMTVSDLGETAFNYIAKSLYSADPYFKGVMSEFTIYDYAMDSNEIKEISMSEEASESAFGITSFYDESGRLIRVRINKVKDNELVKFNGVFESTDKIMNDTFIKLISEQ